MNVTFLMIAYPDVSRNTNMYTDLVQEFVRNSHNVFVVAPSEKNTTLSMEGGANVLRVKTGKLFNVNPFVKGVSNVLLHTQFKKSIIKFLDDIEIDLVIAPTPPITFSSTISFLKKRYNCKSYLILRDIFPQNAKDLGLIKNPILFNYFRKKERQLYNISDSIGCMSQRNVDFVLEHNSIAIEKLHILPNWIKVESERSLNDKIKLKYNLEGKFVAIYGGNIGLPQKAEFILDLADRVKGIKDVIFFIVGKGTEKNKIKKLISSKKIRNVILEDYVPREDFKDLVKQCDIGLVNLSDKFTIPNIPSRTLAYFEAKLPILAAIDKNTDYNVMLEESESGLCSITGDIDSYEDNFLMLYNNKKLRLKMGQNGYDYLKCNLNVKRTYNIIIREYES